MEPPLLLPGGKHDGCAPGTSSVASAKGRVMDSSLELSRVLLLRVLPAQLHSHPDYEQQDI